MRSGRETGSWAYSWSCFSLGGFSVCAIATALPSPLLSLMVFLGYPARSLVGNDSIPPSSIEPFRRCRRTRPQKLATIHAEA